MPAVVYNQPQPPLQLMRNSAWANQLICAVMGNDYLGGYRAGTLNHSLDYVYNVAALWSAAPISFTEYSSAGGLIDPGPGPTRTAWQDPISGGNSGGRAMSVACLIKAETAWAAAQRYCWGRRNELGNNTVRGLAIGNRTTAGGSGWKLEGCDGVAQFAQESAIGTQVQDEMILLVGVMDYSANQALYLNGSLSVGPAASGLTLPLQSGSFNCRAFNNQGNTQQFDGALAGGYVWNRALLPQEIGALYADPYAPFRMGARQETGYVAALSSYFLSF